MSWLIPSRRRIEKLRKFCDSAVATKTSTPAIIIIDAKDYKDNNSDYLDIEMNHFPNPEWKIHVSKAEGMGPKVREVWDRIKDRPWVGILNDDHFLVTKEWDKILISQLTGKNFVTCNDRWNAPRRAAGATLFSMDLLNAWGFPMFPPEIDHLGIDDVFEQLGKHTGCWDIDMATIVEHHHTYQRIKAMEDFQNPQIVDDTHAAIYGRQLWDGSPAAEDTRKRLEAFFKDTFPGALERTKQLLDGSEKVDQLVNKVTDDTLLERR